MYAFVRMTIVLIASIGSDPYAKENGISPVDVAYEGSAKYQVACYAQYKTFHWIRTSIWHFCEALWNLEANSIVLQRQ